MKITRVYASGASWYYVEDLPERNPRTGRPRQKWHKLSKISEGPSALHEALAQFHGQPLERGNMKALLEAFSAVHARGLTLGVRKEHERMYGVIGQAFADFDVAEIQPGDVLDFLQQNFAEKLTARRAYKARLSTFFSWCVLNMARSGLQINPCREIRLAQPPKRRGHMNAAAYWKMHAALDRAGRCFLELTYYTRQRPTEIRLLRESQILSDRIRFEPTKTERSSGEYVEVARSLNIDRVLEQLRALRAERLKRRKIVPIEESRDPYLLVNQDGAPFTKSGLNSLWRRARTAAELPRVTTRCIRPFALSQLEAAGEPVERIREAAAHTTTAQTDAYLNQHRERFSRAVLRPPRRPKG